MEFPTLMDATLSVIPRGIELTSVASGTGAAPAPGVSWRTTYGVVGINAFPDLAGEGPIGLTDGLNEKGLYAGLLYQPGFCTFPSVDGVPADEQLTPTHVIAYALSTCATVAEVRAALAKVTVWQWSGSPISLAVHFRFDDSSGDGIVVEWIDGHLTVFDNPIGVMTNSPNFDWHVTNLRNYTNLRAMNPDAISINGVELVPLGQGTGMHGLPGDATPPDRFVRAAAYVASATPAADGASGELTMMHMVNNFDLVKGFAVSNDAAHELDQTLWTTISNLTDATYSVRVQSDVTFRKITLSDVDFTAATVVTRPLPAQASFPAWNL